MKMADLLIVGQKDFSQNVCMKCYPQILESVLKLNGEQKYDL